MEIDEYMEGQIANKPTKMSIHHQIFHYIFYRIMINKTRGTTTMVNRERQLMIALVKKDDFNLAREVIVKMTHAGRSNVYNIKYLENGEKILLKKVGKAQFHKMRLDIENEGPRVAEEGTSRRREEEAESSGRPTPVEFSARSSTFERLAQRVRERHPGGQHEVNSIYTMLSQQIQSSRESIMKNMNEGLSEIRQTIDERFTGLNNRVASIETDIKDIRDQLHMVYEHHDHTSGEQPSSSFMPNTSCEPEPEPFSFSIPDTTFALVTIPPPTFIPTPPTPFVPSAYSHLRYPAPYIAPMFGVPSIFDFQSPFTQASPSPLVIRPVAMATPEEIARQVIEEAAIPVQLPCSDDGKNEKAKGKGKLKAKLKIKRKK